jgi:acetolactate decarboxylase
MEIIDHRLVGALRVDLFAQNHSGEVDDDDAVFQTSSIEALLDGAYEGDLTVGELLAHGDLGLGTVDHLDGEMIVVDGSAFVARSDGSVSPVPDEMGTPFAAVCRFRPGPVIALDPFGDLPALSSAIDAVAPEVAVLAVRIDGRYDRVVVRSVARQEPPYPPLRDVVAHQREWELTSVEGTLLGFRFPDTTGGLEVPGWHLHFIDDARGAGGHVMEVSASGGSLRFEATEDLHVEVPASIGEISLSAVTDRRSEIDAVEGRVAQHPE